MVADVSFQDQLDSALYGAGKRAGGKALPFGATGRILVGSFGLSGSGITQAHPNGQVPGLYLLEKEASNGVQHEESQKMKKGQSPVP